MTIAWPLYAAADLASGTAANHVGVLADAPRTRERLHRAPGPTSSWTLREKCRDMLLIPCWLRVCSMCRARGGGVMGAASSRRDLVRILNLPIWDDHRFVAKFIHGGQQLDRDMNRDKTGLRHQERKKPAIF